MVVRLTVAFWFGFKLVIGKQEGFIVGGDYVDSVKQFPHVAFLSIGNKKGQYLLCGSSVLNQIILLTAAHCLDDAKKVTAYVGNVSKDKGKSYPVSSYFQHKQWNTNTFTNDIGICKLKKPLAFGLTVKRVVLVKQPPNSRVADLAGWGATEEMYYSETDRLKHTKQKLWNHNQCKQFVAMIPKGTICGGEKKANGNFASVGDSGSALLVQKSIIVGLVSFKDTRVSSSLVVYTDVVYFYDWIKRESRRLACS